MELNTAAVREDRQIVKYSPVKIAINKAKEGISKSIPEDAKLFGQSVFIFTRTMLITFVLLYGFYYGTKFLLNTLDITETTRIHTILALFVSVTGTFAVWGHYFYSKGNPGW